MAFTADITLYGDAIGTDPLIDPRTYALQGNDLSSSLRGDSAQEVDTPAILTIGHEKTSKNVTRHRVRIDQTKMGLDSVTPVVISAYTVVTVPQGAGFTQTELVALVNQLIWFLYDPDKLDKLLNSEI